MLTSERSGCEHPCQAQPSIIPWEAGGGGMHPWKPQRTLAGGLSVGGLSWCFLGHHYSLLCWPLWWLQFLECNIFVVSNDAQVTVFLIIYIQVQCLVLSRELQLQDDHKRNISSNSYSGTQHIQSLTCQLSLLNSHPISLTHFSGGLPFTLSP